MKKRIRYTYIATMVILIASSVQAQDGRFSGLMYGDYYAILQNHEKSLEGENAFWFRRIYLTYDRKLNNSFDYRFRIEMNTSGDFESKSKLVPYIKDAYLKWTKDNHSIYLGISPSPTWEVLESV